MQPLGRLDRLRWNLGVRFCGGTTTLTVSPGGVEIEICQKCGRTRVRVGVFEALIRRPDQLSELFSQMESYLTTRGHYGEASELRLLAAKIEVGT